MNISESNIKYFLIFNQNNIKNLLTEVSNSSPLAGRMKTKEFSVFHANKKTYEEFSKSKADRIGMYILNYLISNIDFEKYLTMYNKDVPEAATTFPSGINSNYINRVKVLKDLPGYQKWIETIQKMLNVSELKFVDLMTEGKSNTNNIDDEIDNLIYICNDKKRFTLFKRYLNKRRLNLNKILTEISRISSIGKNMVDDGPKVFTRNIEQYNSFNEEQASNLGFTILDNIIPTDFKFEEYNTDFPKGPPASNLNNNNNKSNKFNSDDDYNKWIEQIDKLVKCIGYEYVKILNENIENPTINTFLNEIFNVTDNLKFYITIKDNIVKIGRTYNDLNKPLNIISIITENTNDIFISKLININDVLSNLDNKDYYFNNGNNFIIFEIKNNQLMVSDIVSIYKKNINDKIKNKLLELFKN